MGKSKDANIKTVPLASFTICFLTFLDCSIVSGANADSHISIKTYVLSIDASTSSLDYLMGLPIIEVISVAISSFFSCKYEISFCISFFLWSSERLRLILNA